MGRILNKIGKFLYDSFTSIKLNNILDLVIELTDALRDGKLTEEEKKVLVEKAEKLLTDLEV